MAQSSPSPKSAARGIPWRETLAALRTQEWLMALAGLTSVALVIAALLDFGDPIRSARLEVEKGARVRADLVELTFQRLLASDPEPAPALGKAVTLPDAEFFVGSASRDQAPSERMVPFLIESGLFEAAAGDLEAARRAMESVLLRAPLDPRAIEARLHLARWASARGDADEVVKQRTEILEASKSVGCWLEATSVALLSTLIHPVDAAAAAALLAEPAAHLPRPADVATLGPDGIAVQLDPWWAVLHERLERADPTADWRGLFLIDQREGAAVRRALGSAPLATKGTWTLQRSQGSLVAARLRGDGVRVLALAPEALAASVSAALDSELVEPYSIRFGPGLGGAASGDVKSSGVEQILPERVLGPDALSFAVLRADPLRSGRRELFRLRLVRASLLALALGILVAAVLSARATDRARRLSRLRSTFVASVSHDLRTPIQSMLLMSETLEQDRVKTDTGRRRYFGSIRREAQRLRRLVEDLLDGARIDRGEGARVERQLIDTERYFDELEGLMKERAQRADGRLTFERASLPKALYVDPDGLHRAAWNLFENALKYGRQGEETAEVAVRFDMDGGALTLVVEDGGPGIPARFAETLFQPFERASAHAEGEVDKDTGTGLGLSIVRAITRAHGGDAALDANSKGARFVATFLSVTPPTETA